MTLVPAAFLLAWELGLRLAGYGHDSCLFALDRQEGVWRTQPEFGWRFFLRELAPQPVGVSFPAEKAPGAYRIFIMGGSAAQGSPATSFGFWRILERMLRRAYPEGRFEVVNTA
ncbi:MAG: hypothetical protein GTO31_01005, partial [Xanthomonadales bacterium]|nr:hypothetical protein [Xanthomonadales bacterium]